MKDTGIIVAIIFWVLVAAWMALRFSPGDGPVKMIGHSTQELLWLALMALVPTAALYGVVSLIHWMWQHS